MRKIKILNFVVATLVFLLLTGSAVAQTARDTALKGLKTTATTAQLQEGDPATTIGAAIGIILGALGLVLFIITIYGGVQMMTAAGKEDQYDKGKRMIIEGVIGMIICLGAYALSTFVVLRLTQAITTAGEGTGENIPAQ